MRYLIIMFSVFLFSCSYSDTNYDIHIPEIEKYCDSNKSEKDKIKYIKNWIKKNIKYKKDIDLYGYLDYFATPEETYNNRSGDCEDLCTLFGWLLYQYLDIKITYYIAYKKNAKNAHVYCYIEKHNFYFNKRKKSKFEILEISNHYQWFNKIY